MTLWKYRLWRLRVWLFRIIFFPLWLPLWCLKCALPVRTEPNPCACYLSGDRMLTHDCEMHKSDDTRVAQVECKAAIEKIIEPIPETDEPIRNGDLRRLQLLTSWSAKVRAGLFAADHFALIDGEKLEGLGTEVRVKFVEWYPKAMWIKEDGSIRISYDTKSALFIDIQKKAEYRGPAAMHASFGPEFVFQLETDEVVTMYCGSRSMRRQCLSIHREEDHECILTVQKMATKKFAWSTTKFTPVKKKPLLWMGEPIHELGNKRLWNIIQAVEKGTWASGKPAFFSGALATALEKEYSKRQRDGEFSKKKIKRIKKKNREYEVKFCTHGRDPNKTYPHNCPRCKKRAKKSDQFVSRGGPLNY